MSDSSHDLEWSKGVELALSDFLAIYQKHFIEPDRVAEDDLNMLWNGSQSLDRAIYKGFTLMASRFRKERKPKEPKIQYELTLEDLGL